MNSMNWKIRLMIAVQECACVGRLVGKSVLCDDGQMCGCGEVMLTADYPDGMLTIGVYD